MLWEASDRVCGKRLRVLAPILVEAMERHGHLQLAPEVRAGLLRMSAATIDDGLLREACETLKEKFGIGHSTVQVEDGGSGHICAPASESVV